MPLTSAQKTTLKTSIAANTNHATNPNGGADLGAINTLQDSGDNYAGIANWYNLATAYLVWSKLVSKPIVDAQIVKANFTPADAAPASTNNVQGTNDALLFQNRALVCQLKQSNAQWLTAGAGAIDATLASVRQNFVDCLRSIPSGASGANQDAGWGAPASPGAVRLAMMRVVSNLEKLYVVTTSGPGNTGGDARGGNTNPDVAVFEGAIGEGDVRDAILNG